jgi:lipopolysaccharide biosynthesis regulator YciM
MKKKVIVLGSLGAALFVARYGYTCMSGIMYGIHFRGVPVDFGAPPPRFTNLESDDNPWHKPDTWRPGSLQGYDYGGDDSVNTKNRVDILNKGLTQAMDLERQGEYEKAVAAYRDMNKQGLGSPSFIFRRIALLSSPWAQSHKTDVLPYLTATPPTGKELPLPEVASAPLELRPYLVYENASRSYDAKEMLSARVNYETCVLDYPKSPVSEAAMMQVVRIYLLGSAPKPADIELGEKSANSMLSYYPQTRFRGELLGLLGRVEFLQGRYAQAAGIYEKQYQAADSQKERFSAINSLIMCGKALKNNELLAVCWLRWYMTGEAENDALYSVNNFESRLGSMSATEAASFRNHLKDDPKLAAGYLQFRLEMTNTTKAERNDLLKIAAASLAKSDVATRSRLLARYAQLQYANDDLAGAMESATQVVETSSSAANDWALAKFLQGAVYNRQGNTSSAIKCYQAVADQSPKTFMAPSAREAMAYIYDRQGDLGKSLDQLYALNVKAGQDDFPDYSADINYLIDVKMTPHQLRAYIDSHVNNPLLDQWMYSLGLRYLRLENFSAAEGAFKMLSDEERKKFVEMGKGLGWNNDTDPIQDPLQTCKDLRQLRYEAAQASGGEAKAAALYKLASYYYERRDLLLYNAPLWQGGRAMSFDYSWCKETAQPVDTRALRDHQYEHECGMHAYAICQEIVKDYPHSSVAPRALYRAACIQERLSNLNGWWRNEALGSNRLQLAADLMKGVAVKYPKSDLVKASLKYGPVFAEQANASKTSAMWVNGATGAIAR